MIHAILIVNNQGKPRLTKFYEHIADAEKQRVVQQVYQLVSKRGDHVCNFLESVGLFSEGTKLVYRHYATLFFVFVVDATESELGILDLIQVFVETLDQCFENVCELDLIFHADKVHYILDEIVMGGMVLETNGGEVLSAVQAMHKMDQQSLKLQFSKQTSGGSPGSKTTF